MAYDAGKSRILVVGCTGYIGRLMTRAALELGHETFLLVRPDTAYDIKKVEIVMGFKQQGARLLEGCIDDHESLVAAAKSVDVVVSAIAETHLSSQLKLVDAIKEAGNIKRFLPSEFGIDPDRMHHAREPGNLIFQAKRAVRRAVEEAKIPYTYVSANCFAGYFLAGLAQLGQFMPPRDKAVLYGDGAHKVIWVAERDVGLYSLSTVDDPRTLNKTVYIRPPANVLSQEEVVQLWEEMIGKKLEKSYLSEPEFLAMIPGATTLFNATALSIFYHIFYRGELYNFDAELEASVLYPNVDYTTASQYLGQFV